ncbi:MAG: sulfatase [Planctomycetaceae bacterium]|nr:sulfatase [Planctomycetaceae bacterium]
MHDLPSLNRRAFLKTLGAGAAALTLPRLLLGQSAPADRPPNVIVIFTDDQGYHDLGCFGAKNIKTPNIDRMAAEGMKFTDFYCAAPVCSPSRAALLTGCYPPRVNINAVLFPASTTGLSEKEVTIADILKKRGYATACIGKWHLGHHAPFLPTRHGFDEFFGLPYSNDMKPLPLLEGDKPIEHGPDQSQLTRRYTERAVAFIKKNKDRPFFLYLPHTMPHVPLAASAKFKGKSKRGLYGDVIEEIDWSTGEILAALKEQGLDERTLVIFTSDNGPWLYMKKDGGSADPLFQGKTTTYEGGMREPCVMRWPGKIPAGAVCSQVAATIDLLPTIAALAGAAAPADRVIDGRDIAPLMLGKTGAASPHEAFYYYNQGKLEAVRAGKWKLRTGPAWRKERDSRIITQLFDLEKDVGELHDVSKEHPNIVSRLQGMMDAFDAKMRREARPCGRVAEPATQPAAGKGKKAHG